MSRRVTHQVELGFTLIELLVALMIFGLLASAGVLLLRGSVQSQLVIGERLNQLGDVQRAISTMDADLSQATPRISRTVSGALAPAFYGRTAQGTAPLFEFVRGGWSNPSKQRHPSIQKIEYWWRDGALERIGYPAVDGADAPEPSILLDKVTAVVLRYRAANGEWTDDWTSRPPTSLPVALEMTLSRKTEAPFTMRFLVGPAVGQTGTQELRVQGGPNEP